MLIPCGRRGAPPCRWEGITLDTKRNVIYAAMSAIRYGMEDNAKKGKASTE